LVTEVSGVSGLSLGLTTSIGEPYTVSYFGDKLIVPVGEAYRQFAWRQGKFIQG
jgi:hypothetical protein